MAINLLPVKQKRFARTVYQTHRLIAILIVSDLLLLSVVVLLVALNIRIKQEKNNNTTVLTTLSKKSSVLEFNRLRDEVGLISKYAVAVKANIASSTPAVSYLDQVTAAKISGISITSLNLVVESKDQKIVLTGVSSGRQNLLDFKSKLELLPWVDGVDSPVTNLVGDTNAPFSLTITLVKTVK